MGHNVLVCLGGILLRTRGYVYDISSPLNDRDCMFRRYAKGYRFSIGGFEMVPEVLEGWFLSQFMVSWVELKDNRWIFLNWMHSGLPLWFPSESRGIVSVKMERGLCKPIDLYESVGGEVKKF